MLARSLNNLERQEFGYQSRGSCRRLSEQAAKYVLAGKAHGALSRARGPSQSAAGRAGLGSRVVQPADRQLGRADLRLRPSAAETEQRERRVVGPRERELPSTLRHDDGARTRLYGRRQRNDRERRHRQRSVRQTVLQVRRRSDRPALRSGPSRAGQYVPHRRRRPRREVCGLSAQSTGAAHVLRAAGANGRLQGPVDGAHRTRIALRRRDHARHEHAARCPRTDAHQGAVGGRFEPDHEQREDDAAAG